MKKIFLLFTLIMPALFASAQVVIPRQELPYSVKYHWGIINVDIARGLVTVESDGSNFYGTLDGTSIPWEGHIICVSDTLNAQMSVNGNNLNERVAYQNGWYRRPHVNTFRSSTYNPDDPAIYKSIDGSGQYPASGDSMEAITVTSDMLGLYYFSHLLNFEQFPEGERIVIPIEGPYSRELVITYNGKGVYNGSGGTYPTYDCVFEYGYDGRMSGYPIECKISADGRIPVYFSASLPVGHVEMLYEE